MKKHRLTGLWLFCFSLWSLGCCLISAAEEVEEDRQYFNEKEVPENLRDLRNIQKALQETLPQARAATVSIDLGGGSGSGVIVSGKGLVLTAAHVSAGVGKEMTVIMGHSTFTGPLQGPMIEAINSLMGLGGFAKRFKKD